jgi:hypothetical protein
VTGNVSALSDIHRPVLLASRSASAASRFAGRAQIAAPVLVVAGVVMALAGLPSRVAGAVIAVGVASYFAARFAHQRALADTRFIAEENARIVAMLSDGKVDDAARAMDALLVRARISPKSHAVLLVLRAALFTRANDTVRAKEILVAVHDSNLLGTATTDLWNVRVRSALAVVDASRGDLDAAEAWLEPLQSVDSADLSRELVVSRVVLDARRGRYAEVEAAVDQTATLADLGDAQKKLLGVLRAFSIDRGAPDGGRASEVESSLREVGPVEAWEIDYLRSQWPMLTTFCDEHRLGIAAN